MEQLRVIEITIKPPFNFFVMIQGQTNIYFETKSLSKAKRVGEELLLKEGKYSFIHSVYYSDDKCRLGWLSERILKIEDDFSWSKDFCNFIIHPAFLYNYDVRKWNPKLFDKIRVAYASNELRYEDSWEYTEQYLGLDKQQFQKNAKNLMKKVERKFCIPVNDYYWYGNRCNSIIKGAFNLL